MSNRTSLQYIKQTTDQIQSQTGTEFKELSSLDDSNISLIEVPQDFSSDLAETRPGVLINVACVEHNNILLSLKQVEAILDQTQSSEVIEYVFSYSRSDSVPCFWCGETVHKSDSQFKYARKAVFEEHHPTLHKECFEELKSDLTKLSQDSSEMIFSYTV